MTDEPLITLDRVSVGYGRDVVLADLNLVLRRGSFTAVLGGNGSGKSTLLKTVAGLLPVLQGQIKFHPVAGRAPVVGYVPQRESLDAIFPLTSFEAALMGTYGRVKPGRALAAAEKEFVRECLRQTGAEDVGQVPFSQLSGGQKQRVLIARALATRPDLLLLDEPTAGIDVTATRAVMELLRDLHAQHRITIVLVSHELAGLRRFAEDVVWLRDGVVLHGSVTELLTRERVTDFFNLEDF